MPNEIIINDTIIDISKPSISEVSPYDSSFPIKFLSGRLQARMKQAEQATNAIYTAIVQELPILFQVSESFEKGYRYVVDATESTLDAIESGKIKLTTNNSGLMFAQIREDNGHFGSKLPIKREQFSKGIDPVQIANAMQMKALQQQIEELSNQITEIDHNVKDVLLGQQNDRIGLYYSGVSIFLEAQNINDESLKKALIAQALRGLSESTFQLTLMLQTDISYLLSGGYQSAKGKKAELIQSRIQNIHQSFAFIHQATMLRAGIYCDLGEFSAMSTVLEEYSHFIKENIAKNAPQLAQCDTSDNGTEFGTWRARANFQLNIDDLAKQLKSNEKTIYISVATEDNLWQK